MQEEEQVSSGEPSVDSENQNEGVADGVKADGVSYETHRKLLGEKKKLAQEFQLAQKKLQDYERSQQELKEQQLKDQDKWKEYAEEQEKKRQEIEAQLNSYRDREVYQAKVGHVVKAVPEFSSKYHHLIDVDSIQYDPATGDVDESSLQKEVERIRNTYPEVIAKPQSASFNGQAPRPNGQAQLTPEQYARLSKDEKKARAGELPGMPDWLNKGY